MWRVGARLGRVSAIHKAHTVPGRSSPLVYTWNTLSKARVRTFSTSPTSGYLEERLAKLVPLAQRESERTRTERESRAGSTQRISLIGTGKGTGKDTIIRDVEVTPLSPLEIAKEIDPQLSDSALVVDIDGRLCNLTDLIPVGAKQVRFLDWTDARAKDVFWHSSAHVLGHALESHSPDILLCDGPAQKEGFFYEYAFIDNRSAGVHQEALRGAILKECQRLGTRKKKHRFIRVPVSLQEARDIFAYNPHKLAVLDKVPANADITVYRCGNLIDLCRGPHVPDTGYIKTFTITDNGAAVSAHDPSLRLHRVYGLSFPNDDLMKAYEEERAQALARDHRHIGPQQQLFMFHPWAAGSAFFLPHGVRVFNAITSFIRQEYRTRGFEEVITPQVYAADLWKTSGHWEHYADDMYAVVPQGQLSAQDHSACCGSSSSRSSSSDATTSEGDGGAQREEQSLKPMNCPGHCLIFKHTTRSYRDLPLRFADFSPLHRNEISGALSGLTRVRRFHQDDAHIFCTPEQIAREIDNCLDFVAKVYGTMGFTFELRLSTRPDSYVGDLADWDAAEIALTSALDSHGEGWTLNPGDGAFYGPKIDIVLSDALKKEHQCATIQLDFQLPQRFDLHYIDANGDKKRPIMIHRAVVGSVERMMAILIEQTAGRWPFWLSPRQAIVITLTDSANDYAVQIQEQLSSRGYHVDTNLQAATLKKKVRAAQMAQYNYILVVGEKEKTTGTVSVRDRDSNHSTTATLEQVLSHFEHVQGTRSASSQFEQLSSKE